MQSASPNGSTLHTLHTSAPPTQHAVACHIDFALSSVASRAQLSSLPADLQPQHAERVVRCGPGSVVGEVDFMLQRPCR